jgi:hypothetical protein
VPKIRFTKKKENMKMKKMKESGTNQNKISVLYEKKIYVCVCVNEIKSDRE